MSQPKVPRLMSKNLPFKMTHVSHACLKYEGQHGVLLSDPWMLNEPVYSYAQWKFPAAVIPPQELLKDVDTIYITHSHEDHFHIPSLDHIRRDMRIVIAEYTHHSSMRAQVMERVLRAMGFHNIRKLAPWESYTMKNRVKLTSIPSAVTRGHDWENSGFVLDHPGCRVINMNDNITDEALCAEIHKRFPYFDMGLIQTAGVSTFPACFIMPAEKAKQAMLDKANNFAEQDRLISMLKLKNVVPIAGDFGWYDDRYFEYNETARATPIFLEEHIRKHHPTCNPVRLYPSDTWSPETGRVQNHPDIDWDNYVDAIRKVKTKFQKKIDHYDQWIDASSREKLWKRTQERIALINKWIPQQFIDFTASFRIKVDGKNSGFSFVMRADPVNGFRINENDSEPADQTLFMPERIWAAVLEEKIMLNMLCWAVKVEEHVPFRADLGRFWSWIEYYLDLGNKNSQAIIEPILFGQDKPIMRPKWGAVTYDDDWDRSWLK